MPITTLLPRLWGMLGREPQWNAAGIRDEWFNVHFHWAADQVHRLLSPHVDLRHGRLADFGCGDGITGLGLVLRHGYASYTGFDIRRSFDRLDATARREIGLRRLPRSLSFRQIAPGEPIAAAGPFEAVMSWSAFEHIGRDLIPGILADIRKSLVPGGLFMMQVDPLYYSPFGSHLGRFIRQPWAHLLYSDEEVKAMVRAARAEDVPDVDKDLSFHEQSLDSFKEFILSEYAELNRLTADDLVRAGQDAGFTLLSQERHRATEEPPAELIERHGDTVLREQSIFALFKA